MMFQSNESKTLRNKCLNMGTVILFYIGIVHKGFFFGWITTHS